MDTHAHLYRNCCTELIEFNAALANFWTPEEIALILELKYLDHEVHTQLFIVS